MKANYYDFHRLFDSLYVGVALTEARLSDNAEAIRRYLCEGGAADIGKSLGVGFRIYERGGEVLKKEFCFLSGEEKGQALTVEQVQNIGLFLPGGPLRTAVKQKSGGQ